MFVPQVPYSGSLKSHLTAPLALVMDPARAFALVSVLFYLAYVAGLFRLALLVAGPRAALLAGLYAAFSPAFVTRYSLSNDGNYVEVLALGTWALWLAARWTRGGRTRARGSPSPPASSWASASGATSSPSSTWPRSRPCSSLAGRLAAPRSLLALGVGLGDRLRPRLALEPRERVGVLPLPGAGRGPHGRGGRRRPGRRDLRPRREAPADGDRPLAGADGVRHRLRAGRRRRCSRRWPGWASPPPSSPPPGRRGARGGSARGPSPRSCSSPRRTSPSPLVALPHVPATPATSSSSCRSCRSSWPMPSARAPWRRVAALVLALLIATGAARARSPRCRPRCGRTRGGGSSWPTWSARACASATRTSSWPPA